MAKFIVPSVLIPIAVVAVALELAVGAPDLAGPGGADLPEPTQISVASVDGLRLEPQLVASGFEAPVDIVSDPMSDRLFVVEKMGRIRLLDEGLIAPEPFVDISDWVMSLGNEQGLLSLRFHPDFENNRKLYVFFTDRGGTSRLAEAKVYEDDRYRVDPATLRPILTIPQYGQYHQSGSMFFGPDGYLWLSIGDGGGIGDPDGQGQNPSTLESTVVRLDVDTGYQYLVPGDNPLVGRSDARPEVWAYGLRNPWRITYDLASGLLFIPDVGQEGAEELNVVPLNGGGYNFGWSVSEGTGCYRSGGCDMTGQTMPSYQYLHDGNGCAMVGGQVYRGSLMPQLQGHFFFADYCLGWIRSVVVDTSGVDSVHDWTLQREDRIGNVTTIGSDNEGELYAANLEGEIWRFQLADD